MRMFIKRKKSVVCEILAMLNGNFDTIDGNVSDKHISSNSLGVTIVTKDGSGFAAHRVNGSDPPA